MPIPVIFGCIMIFVIWLHYEIRKTNKIAQMKKDKYWSLEQKANSIRRKDIANLNYISVPINQLPISDQEDPTINSYRDIILWLSNQKILDLSGYTNTDLKLIYGTANINFLTECDNNYTTLISILHKWGERLYSKTLLIEATSVLEYAVSCHTQVRKTYLLLGTIYQEQNLLHKIDELIEVISQTNIRQKETLIIKLKDIKNL